MDTTKNKLAIIIGSSLCGLILIGVVIGSIVMNQPKYMVARAITNTINDFKKSDVYTTYDNVTSRGSAQFTITNDDADISFTAKGYFNKSNISSVVKTSITEDDDLLLDANFYINNSAAVFETSTLGDGDNYGISFRNAKKNLPGSVFDPDEETPLSFTDDDAFESFMNIYSTLHKMNGIDKDMEKLEQNYRSMFIAAIDKNSETTKGKDTIKTADGKLNCTTVAFEVDEEAFMNSVLDIIDYAQDDPKLREIVEEYAALYSITLQEDPEDLVDSFYDELESLADDIEDEDYDSKDTLLATFYIKNSRVVAFEMEVEDELTMTLILGTNMKDPQNISFTAESADGNDTIVMEYNVSEDSSKKYEAEITFEEKSTITRYYYDYYEEQDSEPSTYTRTTGGTISIEWDKKKGDFSIEIEGEDNETVTLEGTYIEKGNLHTFTFEEISYKNEYDRGSLDLTFTVVLNEKDRMPSQPRYVEITKLDEDDLEDILEDYNDDLEDIFEDIFDALEDTFDDIDTIL